MSGYLLFKSLHLIAVISWMAGLLYLPRIFVYHVENFEKEQATEIFETMERRLYNYIMRPAMILSWLFGIILIWINGKAMLNYYRPLMDWLDTQNAERTCGWEES